MCEKQILLSRQISKIKKTMTKLKRSLFSYISEIFPLKHRRMVDNKAKGRISKRVLQENKTRQISEKLTFFNPWYIGSCVRIRGYEMFVFRKIWRVLFSCDTRFAIRRFALLPRVFRTLPVIYDNACLHLLLAVNYFYKKAPSKIFERVLNTALRSTTSWTLLLYYFPGCVKPNQIDFKKECYLKSFRKLLNGNKN